MKKSNFIKLGDYQIRFKRFGDTYHTDILDHNGVFVSSGRSVKSPKDQFCRKIGRKISLKHAIEKAGELIPKGERRDIWEAYRTSMTKKARWGEELSKYKKEKIREELAS